MNWWIGRTIVSGKTMLSVDSKVDVGHSAFQSDRKFKDEDGGNLIHRAVGAEG